MARDELAADLRCSLFASALQSYKRDSVLRPFPASYARGDCKDFEALVSALFFLVLSTGLWNPSYKNASPQTFHSLPGLGEGFHELRTHPTPNVNTPNALCGCFLLSMTSDSQE